MALLLVRVDTVMLRYLPTSMQTFTSGLAARMVQYGDYALILPTHGAYIPSSTTLGLT